MAAVETTFTIRAKTEDFAKAGAEVDKLGAKVRKQAYQGPNYSGGSGFDQGMKDFAKALRAQSSEQNKAFAEQRRQESLAAKEAEKTSAAKVRATQVEGAAAAREAAKVAGIKEKALKKEQAEAAKLAKEYEKAQKGANFFNNVARGLGFRSFDRFGGGGGGGGGSGGGGLGVGVGAPGGGKGGDGDGAFTQGIAQSITKQPFIQRGAGMLAQVAGLVVGKAVSAVFGAAGSLAMAPFNGASALTNAAAALFPPLGKAMGAAVDQGQREIGLRREMQGVLPSMFGPGGNAVDKLTAMRAQSKAMGREMGMTDTEAMQMLARSASGTGAYLSSFSSQSRQEALRATALGIDPATSLGLARGEQRGIASSGQAGVSLLSRSIADAFSLKLEGSDIGRYVQQIAANIEDFDQSGIKVTGSGIGQIDRTVSALTGATGRQALNQGQGFLGAVGNIMQNGASTPEDLLLLRQAGFDPNKPNSYYEAIRNLGDQSKLPDYLLGALKDTRRRGAHLGRNQRAAMEANVLGRYGINTNPIQAFAAAGRALPTREALAAQLAASGQVAGGLGGAAGSIAAGVVAPSTLSVTDEMQRKQDAGIKMVGINRALDSSTSYMVEKMADAGEALYDFGGRALAAGKKLMGVAEPGPSQPLAHKGS